MLDELFSTLRSEYKNQAKSNQPKLPGINYRCSRLTSRRRRLPTRGLPKSETITRGTTKEKPLLSPTTRRIAKSARDLDSAEDCYVTKMGKFYEEYDPMFSLISNSKIPTPISMQMLPINTLTSIEITDNYRTTTPREHSSSIQA